jgi:phosphoenolpyruvate-protein kinase (PTS system EI component)
MSFTNTTQVNAEHQEWLKGLDFYKEDIHILENRLTEIASKNTAFEARQGIEHFQNQFLVQRNNIDELRHKIKEHISTNGKKTELAAEVVENEKLAEHENLKDEYLSFEKVIKDLRQEFNIYLAKWM